MKQYRNPEYKSAALAALEMQELGDTILDAFAEFSGHEDSTVKWEGNGFIIVAPDGRYQPLELGGGVNGWRFYKI